jgi:Zn-dependent protease with chaperone function
VSSMRSEPVAPELAARERAHRRATLVAIAALLAASTSPLLMHHVPVGLDTLLAGIDHIGALCLTALHLLVDPLHSGLHYLLAAGVLYALWDRAVAWRNAQRTLGTFSWHAATAGSAMSRAARVAGLDVARLRMIPGLPVPALTVGWLRPVVYVAAELPLHLNSDELEAVLAHEAMHVRRRDPLRLSLLRFLALTLFWIPALRRLTEDVADEAEVLADDHAARGRPLVLASALVVLAGWRPPRPMPNAAVGLLQGDLLERRVRRLAGETPPTRTHVTRRSLATALLAVGLAWTSSLPATHPLPVTGTAHGAAHCEHSDETPLSHLFCLGFPFSKHDDCPHGGHA